MQCQQHNSITAKSISGSPGRMIGAFRAQASAHPVTVAIIYLWMGSFSIDADNCSLKATIYKTVFLSKLESFGGAVMRRRFRRNCSVCGQPDLKNISSHLVQVHGLSSE